MPGKTDKLLGALGLAKRAGALAVGFDAVKQAVRGGKAALVLLAQDASDGTCRRIKALCAGHCPAVALPLTQQQVAQMNQKPAGVLAVTNTDLAALCQKQLHSHKEEPD